MADAAGTPLIEIAGLELDAWDEPVRDVVEAVLDVARRLDHNVIGLEHLMVVGAENGVGTMAQAAPSLAAFREALLDLLFDARETFRNDDDDDGEGDDEERLWLRPELLRTLERMQAGDEPRTVMLDVMLGHVEDRPIIARALSYARGEEGEVSPPDTDVFDRTADFSLDGMDSVAMERAADAAARASTRRSRHGHAAEASVAESLETWAEKSHAGHPAPAPALQLPLIRDLLTDSAHDLALIGREALLDQVARVLLRFQNPAVVLVGRSGAGKTAFVRGLARAAAHADDEDGVKALAGFHFYQLKLLDLVAQGHQGQDIHNIVDQLLTQIASDAKGVLVIDDLHMLVAKQGAPMMSDVIDTVKFHIKKGSVRALLTVDEDAYNKGFSQDRFFSSELTVKNLPPLERGDVIKILGNLSVRLQKHFGVTIGQAAIDLAAAVALDSAADYAPPGSAIRILDEACALARARGDETVLPDHVQQSIRESETVTSDWDKRRLASLERAIGERVLGQEHAAAALSRRVRLAKLKLDRKPERPDGVFLCIGPSGVGKTEMARALSEALYDDETRMVRLDMSEYMEPHSVARIIGAPPGYVGYGEEGALTGPVSRLGHCVVLLDEIEKAHPQVLNLFLQVFDDGRLTDSRGRTVAFSDCVIIMTSNIGRELYAVGGDPKVGFGKTDVEDKPVKDAVRNHLLRILPPEFVNRIDELIAFRVLGEDDIKLIAAKMVEQEVARWAHWGKAMTYEEGVVDIIGLSGYDPRLGARHIERNVERFIIALMSDAAVKDGFDDVRTVHLATKDGKICIELDGKPFECLVNEG